jgi:phospholipid/cholesterol/gamma-HCH transport system substrate-binding protein
VGLILVFVAVEFTVGTGLFQRTYHLWAEYDNVEGLKTGDAVQVAGVKMGAVDAIDLTPEAVRVRLRLDHRAQVRRDSVARLDYQALSGTRFVSISIGSPRQPLLNDGDTISSEKPPGISDMLDRLSGVAGSVTDLAQSLNRNQEELLQNLNRLVVDNQQSLTAALGNLESITEKLDRGQGTIAKLVNDPLLYDRAAEMVSNLQQISGRLAHGEGSLGKLLYDDGIYKQADETLTSLRVTADNLQSISDDIRDGRGTIGRLLVDESLYVETEQAVRGIDRATSALENQAPIAILGTLVTTLF